MFVVLVPCSRDSVARAGFSNRGRDSCIAMWTGFLDVGNFV